MPEHESMDGRYYRTCSDDIRSSQGWFKNILLLGLVNFVPVFGQMSVSGYAYEWGHKAAWGLQTPMPYKIYGRPHSKMLRWGWFALVIAFAFWVVPYLVSALGSHISGASTFTSMHSAYFGSYYAATGASGVAAGVVGGLLQLVGDLGMIFFGILALVGTIRMTVYDRLGPGLQLGKVWKMAKHDFGGLMRIFGMELIVGLVIAFLALVVFGITAMVGGAGFVLTILGTYAVGGHVSAPAGVASLVMMLLAVLPLLLIDLYIVSCMGVYWQLLVSRAVGYWCRQFDVPAWGTKDDPLPFEREGESGPANGGRPEGTADAGEPRGPEEEGSPEGPADPEGQGAPEAPEGPGGAEPGEQPRSEGPVGWRAAGTSASPGGPWRDCQDS